MKKQKSPRPPQPSVAEKSPQTSSASGPPNWLSHPAVHLTLIILFGIVAYSNSFSVPFSFDDGPSIVDNPVIKNLSSFLSGSGYAYNPRRFMGYLTIALNYHFGGLQVFGYHLVNLAIHLITACLVYAFARSTFSTPFFVNGEKGIVNNSSDSPFTIHLSPFTVFVPLLAALLFVTHPIQSQAVTYIVQRLASLATLFYLAAMVCYVKGRLAMAGNGEQLTENSERKSANGEQETGTRDSEPPEPNGLGKNPLFSGRVLGWFVLCLLCTVLAMRTKEIAATLPLVIILYEFSFFGAQRKKRLLLMAPVLLTLLIIPVGIFLSGKPAGELLSDVSAMTRETVDISRGDYLLTQFSVIATYIRLLFFPINQNLDYDYPVYHSLFVPRVFLSFLLICCLLGLAVWLYRKSVNSERLTVNGDSKPLTAHGSPLTALYRLIAFGICWFFITLLVESSFIPIRDVIFEHRLYLPSVGASLGIAGLVGLLGRIITIRGLATAGLAITALLAAMTWNRNHIWQNSVTLWTDAVAKSPDKNRPHYNLGLAYKEENRLDDAEQEYRRALAIEPKDLDSLNNLGIIYAIKGRFDEALTLYNQALAINKDNFLTWLNIGSVYAMQGRFAEAETHFLQAIKLKDDYANTHYNLGLLYQKLNRLSEAEQATASALKFDPRNPQILNNLGVVYLKSNRPAEALPLLEKAVKLQPGNYGYQTNLGRARLMMR